MKASASASLVLPQEHDLVGRWCSCFSIKSFLKLLFIFPSKYDGLHGETHVGVKVYRKLIVVPITDNNLKISKYLEYLFIFY